MPLAAVGDDIFLTVADGIRGRSRPSRALDIARYDAVEMRMWAVAGAVLIGLALIGVGAFALLVPPASGSGWRLDRISAWESKGPEGGEPTVTIYGSTARTVGIGVTAFGSSSCPPELRGVEIGEDEIRVAVADPFPFGGCSADAAPHQFGIAVQRERLPDLPFSVVVRHGDRPATVTVERSLP
jgi:hypothetical protein